MRGFRLVGKVSSLTPEDYNSDDLLHFAADAEGTSMRCGWSRGRTFDREMWSSLVGNGVCLDDYVFVATAIGEDCFK